MEIWKRVLSLLLAAQFLVPAGQSIQQKALTVPPGSVVELKLTNKTSVKGQLTSAGNTGVTLKVAEGGSVTDRTFAYEDIRKIQQQSEGRHTGRKVLIGVAVGFGVVGALVLGLMAAGYSGS